MSVQGTWVALAPLAEAGVGELARLDAGRELHPAFGGFFERAPLPPGGNGFAVREAAGGRLIGTVESGPLAGHDGVVTYVIYLDRGARAGYALEAFALSVDEIFVRGARLVHIEVLAFNRPVLRLLDKVRLTPQALLRRHTYSAGGFHDVLVFGFDRLHWEAVIAPFRRLMPGGGTRPRALGGFAT